MRQTLSRQFRSTIVDRTCYIFLVKNSKYAKNVIFSMMNMCQATSSGYDS